MYHPIKEVYWHTAPDGTILIRDNRIDAIEKKLAEVFFE